MEPERVYDRRREAFERLKEQQQQAASRLSNCRLSTMVLGLAASVFLYRTSGPAPGLAAGFLTIILFGYLVLRHVRIRSQLRYAKALSDINDKGVERTAGRWVAFADSGAEFKDDNHPYASDLDLFGQASVFQWINSTQTALGRKTLATFLTQPPADCLEILSRQEAVTELARNLAWRQQFEAEGFLASNRLVSPEPLLQWAGEFHQAYSQSLVKLGVRVLPAVTISVAALFTLQGAVPWQAPVLLIMLQFLLLLAGGKERSRVLSTVYRQEAQLRAYAIMLERFEKRKFNAQWLRERQGRLRNAAGESAFQQIQGLSKIAERISNRENAVFLVVNVLTLWDYQCMIALEEWKNGSGKLLRTWLQVLADVEAVASLANIRFDNPDWAMPTVVDGQGESGMSAEEMGHPLITRNRVCNNFEMKAPSRINVITGSNMSGKSTFLRTVGLNLVLTYVGAPVCAKHYSCSLMSLWTCMRIADNLEQSISSFYAEILRIKRIVEAARTAKRVCFLLDEIFKGTNSPDRHQGAKALITQLQKAGAFGLISTHDLELGDLERENNGRIKNYHFREYYQDQEIHFDYRLRRGVSTTRNALYLIKMAGIELEEGGQSQVQRPADAGEAPGDCPESPR